MRASLLFLVLTTLVAQGCAPTLTVRGAGYCEPPARTRFQFDADPRPPDSASREEHLAALLGLRDAFRNHAAAGDVPVEARVHVLERIELARLALSAASAELACEGERADQTAELLARRSTTAVQRLTLGSIAIAAIAAVTGVLLSTAKPSASSASQDFVAIGGGALTAGLGVASLAYNARMKFEHARNVLADIWNGPTTSSAYAPVVWSYLTRPEFSNEQRESIRERIVARWGHYQALEKRSADAAILFGAGGSYDAALLRTRSQMLDEVRAEVNLMNQDLEVLAASFIR